MKAPGRPRDEAQRLQVLHDLHVLDTGSEERFDRLTRLACTALDAPMGLVSLVDEDRQWAKSRHGTELKQTSRDVSFCGHAILTDRPLVVEDAAKDPRFADNPLVVGEPGIRFYAGAPLRVRGQNVGTLCIFDTEPRKLTAEEEQVLVDLGHVARDDLEDVASRATEEALRNIIAATPDAVIMADGQGAITEFNPAAERLFGHRRQDMLGRPLTDLMPERYRAMHNAGFDRYLSTGEARVLGTRVELHALHRDGHEVPVELSLAASPSLGGVTFTGILRDLTRRAELEEERVRRRAQEAELAHVREFNRIKSEFINRASHELYTPLTPISLQVELLKGKMPDSHNFRILERNVRRLHGVVEQVMRVARLQAETPLHLDDVDLMGLVRDCIDSLGDHATRRAVRFDVAPESLMVRCDPSQMRDAVLNVLDNAVRHSPHGGTVRVRGQDTRLRIEDDGPGFTPGEEERAFEAFYSGSQGWGLGLFIARTVMHRHGGSIEVLPEAGGVVEMRLGSGLRQ